MMINVYGALSTHYLCTLFHFHSTVNGEDFSYLGKCIANRGNTA